MDCPFCRTEGSKVVNSIDDGASVVRFRSCKCGKKWRTEELVAGAAAVAIRGKDSPQPSKGGQAKAPKSPSLATNSTGGVGGGLSEDQEVSGSRTESGTGSGSDPGPRSDPDAGARARAIPGPRLDLAKLWAQARFAELGGLEWAGTMGLSPPKLAEVTATVRATPSLAPLLTPTMRQFWAEVRDGKLPDSQAYIDNNPLAFGAWVSRFGPYAEKVMGRAPAAPLAAQNGAPGAKADPASEYRPMPE